MIICAERLGDGVHAVMALEDPAATLENAGGKGAALAELARGGLPVPGGFHVTTAAYRQFVAAAGMEERIRSALKEEDAGARIRGYFGEAELPDALREEILAAYAGLGDGGRTIAVRSSATAEDLPDLSFAGQQDTYLNIRGEAALLTAVRDCWASLWRRPYRRAGVKRPSSPPRKAPHSPRSGSGSRSCTESAATSSGPARR
ncbi:PEP/pyruvate-binding domain-containing protein [Streptomyces sp. NPDC026092]|uniref:PEP/pyruvate-binding domain-containing protein n=1 Tax=Streptomyces sp. NPDC026092 TaxID=3154797 RepID=UPI0033E9B9A9